MSDEKSDALLAEAVDRHSKIIVAVCCVSVAVLHGIWPARFDLTTAGVIVVGFLPWLARDLKKLKAFGIEFERLEQEVEKQSEELSAQQKTIYELVKFSLSENLFFHLRELYRRQFRQSVEPYNFDTGNMKRDLRILMDHNYIEWFELEGIPQGENIANRSRLTPYGKEFVELREKVT